MREVLDAMLARVDAWLARGRELGFFDAADADRLRGVERRTPDDLFAQRAARPAVVAFLGGTGVGKSSLLNRLASAPVARVGVERPTSTELTLYVHRDVALADLPPELPVEDVRIERHADGARAGLVWIDAPDFDSTRAHNRQTVCAWLPHIDLLIYVVSPERYRDDAGWRMLLERRGRHGWMFVMNRWDEGSIEQRDDFIALLRSAGFDDPLVLCTSCAPRRTPLPSPDEFDRLESALNAALQRHGLRELERLGRRARLLDLRAVVEQTAAGLGTAADWEAVVADGRMQWHDARARLLEGLQWPLRVVAARLAAREGATRDASAAPDGHALGRLVQRALGVGHPAATAPGADPTRRRTEAGGDPAAGGGGFEAPPDVARPVPHHLHDADAPRQGPAGPAELRYLAGTVWDDWAQARLAALIDRIELGMRRRGLSARTARQALEAVARGASDGLAEQFDVRVRRALAQPVPPLRRVARRVTGFLTAGMPLFALATVTYVLLTRYIRSAAGSGEFPGIDFAISSGMLVLVSWALPFWLDRSLRPSLERTLSRAMRDALEAALDALGDALHGALEQTAQAAQELRAEGEQLTRDLAALALRGAERIDPALARLLMRPEAPAGAPESPGPRAPTCAAAD